MKRDDHIIIYWFLQTIIWFTLWGFMLWYNWAFHGFALVTPESLKKMRSYEIVAMIYGFIMIIGYIGYFVLLLGFIVDASLIEEDNRKLRNEKRKILKLKREVKMLEVKKERLEKSKEFKQEEAKLICQIKQLQKPVDAFKTCIQCGKKVPLASCFCSECGGKT